MAIDTDKRWKGRLVDWSQIEAMDSADFALYALNQRQVAVLLALCEFQHWRTRWTNLSISQAELDTFVGDIEYRLMKENSMPIDCGDVENCLETSTIISNIETNVTNIETNVTNIETNVTNIETNVTNIETTIAESPKGGNKTPPFDFYETDELCNAAEYIKTKLTAFISDTIADAASITLEEFLNASLGLGGWDASLLKLAWDFYVANSNPNLLDEVQDAASEIVNALYCNEFDRAAFVSDIDNSATITADAQAAIIGAFNALTDAQLSLWAFIGSQTATGNCNCENIKVWDFSLGGQLGWTPDVEGRATWSGDGWTTFVMYYGNVIEIWKEFTWPSDLVITQFRIYIENPVSSTFNYIASIPAYDIVHNSSYLGDGLYVVNVPMGYGVRDGFCFGLGIYTGSPKVWKIEVTYTGTPPMGW